MTFQVTGLSERLVPDSISGRGVYTVTLTVQVGERRLEATYKDPHAPSASCTAMRRQWVRRQVWDDMMAKLKQELLATLGGVN